MIKIQEKGTGFQKNEEIEDVKRIYLETADEFADILKAGIYPADITEFIGGIFDAAARRNNLWIGNPDYARAVLPVLFNECPDYYEMTVCMINSINEMKSLRRSFTVKPVSVDPGDDKEFKGDLNINNLALAISGVLTNPDLPESVYNGLMTALNDLYNDVAESVSTSDESPEYIESLLIAHSKKDGAE